MDQPVSSGSSSDSLTQAGVNSTTKAKIPMHPFMPSGFGLWGF